MPQFQEALQALQSVAYAATIDVNPDNGEYVQVATLTGAITVQSSGGRQTGKRLVFDFTQDATGGRVVTWDAIFKAGAFAPVTTASKRNTVSFVFDGSNYVMTAQAAGV